MDPSHAQLLGSPLGDYANISAALSEKVEDMRRLGEQLKLLSAHDTLFLQRSCFTLSKLLYVLRTAPCFKTYDDCLRGWLTHLYVIIYMFVIICLNSSRILIIYQSDVCLL